MGGELRHPLDPARFHYYGVRVGDVGEWELKAARGLRVLNAAADIVGPVHVHFDLDVLSPDEFPHLAYPEAGGPGVEEAVAMVAAIAAQAEIVGLTITEFAPADEAAARAGQAVIDRICRAAAALIDQ
jgi:arginase